MTEHERCDACGFDGAGYDNDALVAAIRSLGSQWADVIERAGTELRVRPAPGVWSAIEYAAHSRDIAALHAFGVEQAATGQEPWFPAIDDALVDAVAVDYGDADPDEVAIQIAAETARLAVAAESAASWDRAITVGADRLDIRRLAEHALHDSTHHLDDVERGLNRLRD